MRQFKFQKILNIFIVILIQFSGLSLVGTKLNAQELEEISESTEVYSILEFSPNQVTAQNGQEITVELIARNIPADQYIEMYVVGGDFVEITSITEMSKDILSIDKQVVNNVASLTIAKTSDATFSEGEVVAAVSFILTGDSSSIIELGEDSNIGGVAIKQSSSKLKIISASDASSLETTSANLDSESAFYNKPAQVIPTSESGDIFEKLSTEVNVDREVLITGIGSIFILLGILASIIIFRPRHEFNIAPGYNSQFMTNSPVQPQAVSQIQPNLTTQTPTVSPAEMNPANLVPVNTQQAPQAVNLGQVQNGGQAPQPAAATNEFAPIRSY